MLRRLDEVILLLNIFLTTQGINLTSLWTTGNGLHRARTKSIRLFLLLTELNRIPTQTIGIHLCFLSLDETLENDSRLGVILSVELVVVRRGMALFSLKIRQKVIALRLEVK